MAKRQKTEGAAKKKKPTGFKYEFYISLEGAPYVPLDSLSSEERERAGETLAKNFIKSIENSLMGHPEQWLALCKEGTLHN